MDTGLKEDAREMSAYLKGGVVVAEVTLVVLLGVICGGFLTSFLEQAPTLPSVVAELSPRGERSPAIGPSPQAGPAYHHLLTYDPFFGAPLSPQEMPLAEAPESSLNITIFGLRYNRTGTSSVILKVQGQDQMRAAVGDSLSPNVRLAGVYQDRVEISRNGVRESVYYQEPSERRKNTTPAIATAGKTAGHPDNGAMLAALITGLDLTLFKGDGATTGFVVGDGAQAPLLTLLGLEAGDLLLSVNEERLISHERLEELPDEIAGDEKLDIKLVRRGVPLRKSVQTSQLVNR